MALSSHIQIQFWLRTLGLTLAISLASTVQGRETQAFEIKGDSIKYLQDLRSRESKRLSEINASMVRKLDDTANPSLDKEMNHLKSQQREHQLRQEFLDRLIFQVDTKFRGGDLRAFLQKALMDMAKVDAVSSAQTENGLWKFLKYSSDAIRRLPEQKENILAFLEGYMNRSVLNPIPPQDYLAARNYTNGSNSETGNPLTREDAGSFADRRLQEMDEATGNKAAPPTLPQTQ